MSALHNELISKIKRELNYLMILFIILFVIFKILFFKESLVIILRTVLSLFWLFIIPGFSLMYIWHEKISFIERIIAGTALGAALIGLLSYYIALAGLHVKFHWFLPLLIIIFSVVLLSKKIGKGF